MSDFSPRLLRLFARALSAELGADNYAAVLEKAGISLPNLDPKAGATIPAAAASQAYADLQKAIRTYYGRGARGILLRVGAQFWNRLLDEAPFTLKPQIALTRGLATKEHPQPALELLARLFSTKSGDLTVHTLDLDLLLVDHPSPTTRGQREDEPICWVTVGMARQALYWASGREFDVTETACRAQGASQCEFKVISS
jgi:predicted hydrocarbon binding protein